VVALQILGNIVLEINPAKRRSQPDSVSTILPIANRPTARVNIVAVF
jgi:hypothetical protein